MECNPPHILTQNIFCRNRPHIPHTFTPTEKIQVVFGMAKKNTLKEQAEEVLRIATEHGVEQNFFFITTFERYQVQLDILADLERKIKKDGALVTKEYVKGRENVYTHPAIGEYNKTCTSANQTVATLIKIIKSLRNGADENDGEDELLRALGIAR